MNAVVGKTAEAYCSQCSPGHDSGRGRCERHGKKIVPNTAERIACIRAAQRHAKSTGKTWVVVFRPRTKGFHEYHLETLRRTPIGESHMVTDVAEPPRKHGNMRRQSRSSRGSRQSRAGRRYGDATVRPWPAAEARHHQNTARRVLGDRHYDVNHTLDPDPDNCAACAIRTGGEEGPDYAGWARIYVEGQKPIPKKWRAAFGRERASDNHAYAHALERSIKTFGMPRFV